MTIALISAYYFCGVVMTAVLFGYAMFRLESGQSRCATRCKVYADAKVRVAEAFNDADISGRVLVVVVCLLGFLLMFAYEATVWPIRMHSFFSSRI